jgi:hypothetical protein
MKRLNPGPYDTEKNKMPRYLRNYEAFFADRVDQEVTLLELGFHRGGSLLMWRDYFEKGRIVGLDLVKAELEDETGRIKCYQGAQDDPVLLKRIASENAADGFDIVIDDCSHIGEVTRRSFRCLFDNHLKGGGVYVIEDWGTGYWDSWPDGRTYQFPSTKAVSRWSKILGRLARRKGVRIPSHDYGMVGFVKELVDECGWEDIARENAAAAKRPSQIERMQISTGQVFVVKKGR